MGATPKPSPRRPTGDGDASSWSKEDRDRASAAQVRWPGLLAAFLFPALGGLLFGYDIGATSFVLVQLQDPAASGVPWSPAVAASPLLQGAITSSSVGGAFCAALVVFSVADVLGRRREMLIAGALYILGALLEAASGAPAYRAGSGLALLMAGRWLYGIGCGFATHAAPAYIAEMSPPHLRGTLVSLKEAMIVFGMLVGYGAGYAFRPHIGGWRYTYGLSALLALTYLVGMYFLPPSARWLVSRGRVEDARASLRFTMSGGVDATLRAIVEQADDEALRGQGGGGRGGACVRRARRVAREPATRAPLVAGLGVAAAAGDGQPSVLYYADVIFADAGVAEEATSCRRVQARGDAARA